MVALGVVFLIIPLIFVFLRFWARAVGQKGVGVDDWLILLALVRNKDCDVYIVNILTCSIAFDYWLVSVSNSWYAQKSRFR